MPDQDSYTASELKESEVLKEQSKDLNPGRNEGSESKAQSLQPINEDQSKDLSPGRNKSSEMAPGGDLWNSKLHDHMMGLSDALTIHINEYIRYYRMVPWVLGSVGVVVFLRYSRTPIARLRQVSDIPVEFVADNRTISGVVKETGWNTVGVWHVPAWRWLLRWKTRPPGELMKFCGLVMWGVPYPRVYHQVWDP
jgi:hypothetical protein